MRKQGALLLALMTVMTLAGCSRSYTTERDLVDLGTRFLNAFYSRDFDTACSFLTGQALADMRAAVPALRAMNVQNKVSGLELKCDWVSRDRTRGDVVAAYVFEQTVPGAGTTTVDMVAVLKFARVAGQWKIYSFATARRVEKS
ncbi:MAG: hypothetical protein ACPLPR_01440 [Bacillota bacterium]